MSIWTDAARLDLALALLGAQLLMGHAWPATATATAATAGTRGTGGRLLALVAAVVVHALALLPWLGPWVLAVAAVASLVHLLIDGLATAGDQRRPGALARAQLLHLIVIAVAWTVLTRAPRPGWSLLDADPHAWAHAAAALGLLALVLRGGIALTAGLLDRFPGLPFDPDTARMGRTIGVLERALVLLLVVLDQWGAVGLVIAAKSLARFEDLKRRHFAEYYLIGTLASLLLACLGGLAIRLLLRT